MKILFYGKYASDMKVIFDTFKDSEDYEVNWNLMGYGKNVVHTEYDYIITFHSSPQKIKGKMIHIRHGYGMFPCVSFKKGSERLKILSSSFRYYRVFNEREKKVFVNNGFPEDQLIIFGFPYSAELLKPISKEGRKKFLLDKNLDPDKKTVMYAPTWDHGSERGFFVEWFKDGKEKNRVEKLCKHITEVMNCNFIVRMHEGFRYHRDWLREYKKIFKKYNVDTTYLDNNVDNQGYVKYSDILIGDLSSINIYFYIMDKPVVHIGLQPFHKKKTSGSGGMEYTERAGYVIDKFDDLLETLDIYNKHPDRHRVFRESVVKENFGVVGKGSVELMNRELRKILK